MEATIQALEKGAADSLSLLETISAIEKKNNEDEETIENNLDDEKMERRLYTLEKRRLGSDV